MILSGLEIKKQVELGNIEIENFEKLKLGPNSCNLTLGEKLLVYTSLPLDMKKDNSTAEIVIPSTGLLLEPNKLYLGHTNERTYTKTYVPMLEGRSSIGRLGMDIHVTAGFGDIGFNGRWTLEIRVTEPLIVYPYIDVCQIYFHTIEGDCELYKSDKYQNSETVTSSRLWKELIQ